MPPKKSGPVEAREVPAKMEAAFTYIDVNGIEQTVDMLAVKNLDETDWAESQKLFPNATQCMIDKDGTAFDAAGRQNVLNDNLLVVEAVRINAGDFGPSFLLHAAHPELGEISVFCPGRTNEEMAEISGISLESGKQVKPKQLPAWMRFRFLKGVGEYNGYFVIEPAVRDELPTS